MDRNNFAVGRVTTGFSKPYVALYSASGGTVTYTGGRDPARPRTPGGAVAVNDKQRSQFLASNMQHYKENMIHAINSGYKTVFDVRGGNIAL